MKQVISLLSGFFLLGLMEAGAQAKIESLTPPLIQEWSIDQRVSCTRPMREGKFNISADEQGSKAVIHCYGHGGSGCTTNWGSVFKAISLFEERFPERRNFPVRVIGTGIIGLTTAIELHRKGYRVAGITSREFYDIPSWKNAGYFALVSVQTDQEEQDNLDRIGLCTFLEFRKISEGKHPYISSDCAHLLPVYCSSETESGIEDLERKGLIPAREYVSLDFGNGVVHDGFVKFYT